MTFLDIIKIGSSILGSGVSIAGFKWAQKKYKHLQANKEQYRILQAEQIEKLSDQNERILKQLFPNGGSSVIDKIEKVAVRLDKMEYDIKVGYRGTREMLDLPCWESNENGMVTYASPALCNIYEVQQSDILDNSWIALIIPEDRQRVIDAWQQSVKFASPYNMEFRIKRHDGLYQKVASVAMHNKDKNGKVINSLGKAAKVGEPYSKI